MRHLDVSLVSICVSSWLALQGCGAAPNRSLDGAGGNGGGDATSVADVAFLDWCAAWELNCPTTPPDNVPDPEQPWTVAQWKSAFALAKAFSESPSDIALTRAEIDSPNLATAVARLGREELLAQIKDRLDAAQFGTVAITGGRIALAAAEASEFEADSGLVIQTSTTVTAQVTAAHDFAVTGIGLKGRSGAADVMSGFGVAAPNVLTMTGAAATVTGVPIKFLFQEVVGIDPSGMGGGMPGYLDLQPAIAPLKDWLTTGTRNLHLDQTTMSQLARHAPALARDPGMRRALTYILERMKSIQSTAASRRDKLVKGEARQEIRCNFGEQAQLMIEPTFGVQSLTRLGNDSVSLVVYGIKAKPLSGIVRPTFRLGRIDLEPRRIVIRDVPVLGSFPIDMSDPNGTPMDLSCG